MPGGNWQKKRAPDSGPPNNWISRFGGSAWTRDGLKGQYYYHAFLPEQPDLNWRDPHVARALADDDPRPVTRPELMRLAEACRASVPSRRAA